MNEDVQSVSAETPLTCLPAHLRKARLRRSEAVEYLRLKFGITVAVSTLAKWASIGGGPGMNKAGVTPLYPLAELDLWAEKRLGAVIYSTSEGGHRHVRSSRG